MKVRHRTVIALAMVTTLVAIVVMESLPRGPALYTVTVLPTLNGLSSYPTAINDRGQVVGRVESSGPSQRAFLWDRENGIQDLGPVIGVGPDINNAGQIAGTIMDPCGNTEPFLWEPGKDRTMLGTGTMALAVNNRGQVLVTSQRAPGTSVYSIWERGAGMKELGPGVGDPRRACFNDLGQALGVHPGSSIYENSWYLLDPNHEAVPLGTFRVETKMVDINNKSCILAICDRHTKKTYIALRRGSEAFERLVPVGLGVYEAKLNDKNQVAFTEPHTSMRLRLLARVFRSYAMRSDPTSCFLWDPDRGLIALNRYVHGMRSFYICDLNNNGCIAGVAEMKDGSHKTALLEPIPERWRK